MDMLRDINHLIEYLLKYMKRKGVDIENKDIIITNGFTEGFDMLILRFTKSRRYYTL